MNDKPEWVVDLSAKEIEERLLGIGSLAPVQSPIFTGVPRAPTPSNNTRNDQIATTAFVQNVVQEVTSPIKAPIYGAYVTLERSGALVDIDDGADAIPMKKLIAHIEPVQSGSGDPSPDNVRPISGWTGANVTRAGKNLIDLADASVGTNASGVAYGFPQTWKILIPTSLKGKEVSWSYEIGETDIAFQNAAAAIWLYDAAGNFLRSITGPIASQPATGQRMAMSISIPAEVAAVGFGVMVTATTIANASLPVVNAQIELGSTATDYEPYTAATYSIDWTDEAGTVYGGTLDVLSGLLTVDRVATTVRQLTWYDSASRFQATLAPAAAAVANNNYPVDVISSNYQTVAWNNGISDGADKAIFCTSSGTTIAVKDARYADAASFAAAMGASQVVYKLATPIVYQLTAQEVSTLLGINNIWADTGSVDVEYRADPTLIYKKLTAAILSVGGNV